MPDPKHRVFRSGGGGGGGRGGGGRHVVKKTILDKPKHKAIKRMKSR